MMEFPYYVAVIYWMNVKNLGDHLSKDDEGISQKVLLIKDIPLIN